MTVFGKKLLFEFLLVVQSPATLEASSRAIASAESSTAPAAESTSSGESAVGVLSSSPGIPNPLKLDAEVGTFFEDTTNIADLVAKQESSGRFETLHLE